MDRLVHFAFIDESGDSSLDVEKSGVSDFYTICAILINGESDLAECCLKAEKIRQEVFLNKEMKSSELGKKLKKRTALLEKLNQLPFNYYAITVDKAAILRDSGLRFKKSFIKYTNRQLYNRLYGTGYPELIVKADQQGRSEFMDGFKKYLIKEFPKTLFTGPEFDFVSSDKNVLVQVADIYAGSVRRLYSGQDTELKNVISRKALLMERWPYSLNQPDTESLSGEAKDEYLIARNCVQRAHQFLENPPKSNSKFFDAQQDTVRFLLYKYEISGDSWVISQEIIRFINEFREEPISDTTFRQEILSKLRDYEVIIASSSRGYKIPCSIEDIQTFVRTVNSKAIPYLRRLEIARTVIHMASSGDYDIVDEKEYPRLHKCLNAIKDTDSGLELPLQDVDF
jgi:hypothetical protein